MRHLRDPNLDNFDRLSNNFSRLAIAGFVVSSLTSLAVLGFLGWVTYKLLVHFNVI